MLPAYSLIGCFRECFLICYNHFVGQYGRIQDIELKIPPRPPGYCFVEVVKVLLMHICDNVYLRA